jgi:hypothetical protein
VDERLKFIARLLDGEKMAGLCREFGTSRKTGYKILTRYNEIRLDGLTDRSRRPGCGGATVPILVRDPLSGPDGAAPLSGGSRRQCRIRQPAIGARGSAVVWAGQFIRSRGARWDRRGGLQ